MKKWFFSLLILSAAPVLAQVNCLTTTDQLGPYFIPNAPFVINDTLAPGIQDSSRALQLTFFVSNNCDTVDLDTLSTSYMVELWHANATGAYSNVDGNPNDFAYRGKLELTGLATVLFTELPGIYPYRPSHIHIKSYLTDSWFTDTLVTQLYFEGDSLIPFDVASTFPERWIRLDSSSSGYRGSFAFGIPIHIGVEEDLLSDWHIFPNPARERVTLRLPKSASYVRITDAFGSGVFAGELDREQEIDVSAWPRGTYIADVDGIKRLLILQ